MAEYLAVLDLVFAVLLTVVGMLGLRGLRSPSPWVRWLSRASVVGAVIVLGVLLYMRVQIASEAQVFRTELMDKIEKAEALAKKIPRGCPDGVDAEAWNAEVEALRKKAADKLGQAFATDRGDYKHECPLEWVWNRLDHFLIRWQAAALALGKP